MDTLVCEVVLHQVNPIRQKDPIDFFSKKKEVQNENTILYYGMNQYEMCCNQTIYWLSIQKD